MQGHPEAAGVLHGAQVEDLGAVGGQLQGLLAGEGLDALGGGDDAGVSGEQAVDVGVDLADVGVEGGGQGDRGRVGAAAAQGGGVLDLVDALEAGDDGDRAGLDGAGHALGQHADDGGLAVLGVGEDAGLGAGVGARRDAELGDGHGEQGHGDALTGGQQDVHLAGGGVGGQGGGLVKELVGRVPHRGDDDDDRVTGLAGGDDAPGDAPHRVDVADGRAAVLLDDQCHVALLGSWNQCVSSFRCSAPVRASWQGLPGSGAVAARRPRRRGWGKHTVRRVADTSRGCGLTAHTSTSSSKTTRSRVISEVFVDVWGGLEHAPSPLPMSSPSSTHQPRPTT